MEAVMLQLRHLRVAVPLTGLALIVTACSSAGTSSDSKANANSAGAASGWTVEAEPDAKGAAVVNAINTATKTVDIPIYSIISSSGEDASFTSYLTAAKARGVNIRVMMNGGYGHASPTVAQAYLAKLKAAPGAGTVGVNYSSNNFSITHQKSIITDAADATGKPLSSDALPSTARLVVSTGNFSAGYPVSNPGPWYGARDFEMTSTNPADIALAEQTFVSDFSCAPVNVIQPPNEQATDRLIWSNGTTGPQANSSLQTPADNYPASYGFYPQDATYPSIKGNVRQMQADLINSAQSGDTLKIYNEEFTDPNSIALLLSAIGRGVKVQVTMTASTPSTPTKANATWDNQLKVAKAGGEVHLYTNGAPDTLYIHAKSIILVPNGATSATAAYAGSTNLGAGSMNFNRELGVNFNTSTGDEAALNSLNNTFNEDWSRTQNVTVWNSSSQPVPPTVALKDRIPTAATTPPAGLQDTPPAKCGSVAATAAKK
ncbi:MAG TPA: hypothetical protein DCQ04_15100 [Actinobacteria bacterium]|nr:hypothetical protein [Actinomycetota bacterium]